MDINKIAESVPNLVAIIFVVIIFVRSQEKRDASWQEFIGRLTTQIDKMEQSLVRNTQVLAEHDASMKVTAATLERDMARNIKKKKVGK